MDEAFSLLDANANRAREGIRTAEDFARFEIQDQRWAERLRGLRHEVTAALDAHFDLSRLTAARRVLQDCGRPGEGGETLGGCPDEKPKAVALRGLKRGQEALRVLEEFTRSRTAEAARAFSETRYGLYEAEQWLECSAEYARILNRTKLYVLLAEKQCSLGLEETTRAAIKGGAGVIQLREKDIGDSAYLERARCLANLCREHDVAFVVNDRSDIANLCGASGVHLGQDDLPPDAVRSWVGERLLIGRSTHRIEEVRRATEQDPVDYIAIGAMFDTATKLDTVPAGLKFAQQVSALELKVPVFAIGGITKGRIKDLKRAGVQRVAVSSAVISARDPESAARELLDELNK